ncbi:hypothetical protein AMR76_22060 [Vibrio furnissii]|uniref:Uncharacterized protein n=1 Tax=Vibrio furnissii TaxID=29494 RepID=A0A0Q2QU94_VIBFU|nr:hypothetical protein [Vibrio furnissii]KQH83605.1 hypothetical protein AMR76_22060 [Vibrio furnissii]
MAFCVEVTQEGFLYKSELPLNECSSMVIQTVDEYKVNQLELNPIDISSLFFFSFGLVLLSYKSAWVVGVIKSVIGKI